MDLTMTEEALETYVQFLNQAAQIIETDIINDPEKVMQLKMVLGFDRPQLKDSIKDFLRLILIGQF